jgi:hypothetical protein
MGLTKIALGLTVAALATAPSGASAQTLAEPLRFLQPLLGREWTGELRSPDGRASYRTTALFQRHFEGTVVKLTTATPEIGASAEGFFYWDREAGRVAVFLINSGGIFQRGYAALEDGVVTVRGTITFPERTFEFRNTFELTADGRLVDRWFQNAFGDWRPGHVVELTAAPRPP